MFKHYGHITDENYFNPYDPTVCLVLWLYSIEPSFYAAISDAYKNIDSSFHEYLWPFAVSIFWIIQYTEESREDRLPIGLDYDINEPLGYFSQSFVIYKAAPMY